jgi:RNA polymerase sigma-70 factor (ECF subfamily)
VPWLEPVPDALVGADNADPAAIVTGRESIRLALVAALQHLPPRQRAVLILRDVLRCRAAEVADLLSTTTAAVNSSLQRARAQLDQAAPVRDEITEPTAADQRELLDRYVTAMEAKDLGALVTLFTSDAVWEMPPFTAWYAGPEHICRHLATRCPAAPDGLRLVPVTANGQPGYGTYLRGPDGFEPFLLAVLTLTGAGISHVVNFFDLRLFDTFGLPPRLPADQPAYRPTG